MRQELNSKCDLVPGELAFHFAIDRQKANDSLRIFEDEARSLWINDCGDQMAISSWDPPVGRRLIISFELAFLHAVHAHESYGAILVLEDETSPDLIGNRRGNVPIGFRYAAMLNRVCGHFSLLSR